MPDRCDIYQYSARPVPGDALARAACILVCTFPMLSLYGQNAELGLVDVSFTRFPENPIVEPSQSGDPDFLFTDRNHVLHQCVRRKDDGSPFMMWYTGCTGTGWCERGIHLATSSDGVNFTKVGRVLSRGPNGSFDDAQVHMPTVIWHDNQWKMWYTGHRSTFCDGPCTPEESAGWNTIGYATSPNGINWTKHGQVFDVNPDLNAFDSDTIREPTVLYDESDHLFKMWYNGTKIGEHFGPTGYATSPDGINWTRIAQVSQDSDRLRGGAIKIGPFIYMFYNWGDGYGGEGWLGYSVSADGVNWVEYAGNPVMSPTPNTWEQSYLQAPSLVFDEVNEILWMYYNAFNGQERIGGATTPFILPDLPQVPFNFIGDFDGDDDVDLEDFGFVQGCVRGSGAAIIPACLNASLDGDLDVDAVDLQIVRSCLSGPGLQPPAACEP